MNESVEDAPGGFPPFAERWGAWRFDFCVAERPVSDFKIFFFSASWHLLYFAARTKPEMCSHKFSFDATKL